MAQFAVSFVSPSSCIILRSFPEKGMSLFSRQKKRSADHSSRIEFPIPLKTQTKGDPDFAIWAHNHRWTSRNEQWCRARTQMFQYRPAVGILMQSLNPHPSFFQESLASIFNQIYPFHELSIVDRGSNDPKIRKLLETIETDPRVAVTYQKGSERDVAAIAKIMKRAEAEWILLMGAEDVLEPNTIYNMVAILQNTVEIDFVFSDSDLLDENGVRFDPQFKPIWAVGSHYPLGYYQHPVMLSSRLVEKLRGHERVSQLMEEGTLLDEASNHSRYVLQATGILYHARARGAKNENPPEPVMNVLINEELTEKDGKVAIDTLRRAKSEPKVPLNVLWAIDSLDRDDGPTVWFHYLRFLSRESGHKFSVVALKDGPMRAEYENLCPVRIVSEAQDALNRGITELHGAQKFDVAFVSSVENTWFPEVLQELKIPALWQLYPAVHQELTEVLKKQFLYPATILFLNSAIAEKFSRLDPRNISRILPTGVDMADLKTFQQRNSPFDLREKYGIAKSSKVFTIVGPTIERKNQEMFVKAALELLQKAPDQEMDFFIVGMRDGAYRKRVEAMIQSSGKAERFHTIAETQSVFQYYPFYLISDVVVSCSNEEVFPLTMLEAMAMKKAVIGTDVFSTREVIEHEENGFLVQQNDHKELADRMLYLLQKTDYLDFFARRSLEIVYEKFHFRKNARRLEDLLRESIVYES
jgi:glycosyltransferase involved in cell wall biosynthesis